MDDINQTGISKEEIIYQYTKKLAQEDGDDA